MQPPLISGNPESRKYLMRFLEELQRPIITDQEFAPIAKFVANKSSQYQDFQVGDYSFKLKHSAVRPIGDVEVETYRHVLDLVYASRTDDHAHADRRPPKQLFLTLIQRLAQTAKQNGYEAMYAYGVANPVLNPLFAQLGFEHVEKMSSGSFMKNWLRVL